MIGKGVGKDDNGNDAIGTDWSGLQIADRHKEMNRWRTSKYRWYKKEFTTIYNDGSLQQRWLNDMKNNTYFLYTLKVEGRDEKRLIINQRF